MPRQLTLTAMIPCGYTWTSDPSAQPATVGVPTSLVLGLTGHTEPEHHTSLRDAGVDRVFTKPVQPRMLAQLVRTLQAAPPTQVRECG